MNTADSINFISKTSVRKVSNAGLILSSYYLSKLLKKPIQWGLPITISIEPTTQCNLECPECPSGVKFFTRPTGYIGIDLFRQLLDQTHAHLQYMYFYFQGEPYLHPQFFELVNAAAQRNIYTVTSTNAHFLGKRKAEETVKSGLDRIIISIDGTTQETYSKYRIGGSLEKVLEGTKNLVEAKKILQSKTPHIVFQFIVMRHNEHQMGEAKQLAKSIGVDELKSKTVQVYDFEHNADLVPLNETFSRYEINSANPSIKNKLLNHCWKLWHSCVMTWDGKIVPCCFDKDASHQLGDINEKHFSAIWQSEAYRHFRAKIIRSRSSIDICTNCSEGTTVWVE